MKLFAVVVAVVVAVCFCFGAGGGPVSFGVGCETVRRRCRRLFLFWGGRGASQLPGCEGGRGASQLWRCETVRRRLFLFWGGRGPVSFVRRRRRRLFLFWGGRGASQLWSLVVSSSVFFRGGRGGESASGVRSIGLCPQSVFAAGGLVPVGFKHSWLSTSHYLLEKHKLCDGDSLRVRGARAPARRRERG